MSDIHTVSTLLGKVLLRFYEIIQLESPVAVGQGVKSGQALQWTFTSVRGTNNVISVTLTVPWLLVPDVLVGVFGNFHTHTQKKKGSVEDHVGTWREPRRTPRTWTSTQNVTRAQDRTRDPSDAFVSSVVLPFQSSTISPIRSVQLYCLLIFLLSVSRSLHVASFRRESPALSGSLRTREAGQHSGRMKGSQANCWHW